MIKGKFNIVIGGQAGSESKGKLAAFLVSKFPVDALVMAASPNAGHTAYVGDTKYVSYHLPISWAANPGAKVLLGPSSVINVAILLDELDKLPVVRSNLMINPRAAIIMPEDIESEKDRGLLKIGSTNQGVGVARARKLMRTSGVQCFAGDVEDLRSFLGDTVTEANSMITAGKTLLCEMTQGFDLDLEHGIDPIYCTSKMINPAMALAEAGVSPRYLGHVYGVIRPYPIRVNNREGWSGPYEDSPEIAWEVVEKRSGCPHPLRELTTTTRLPRRVFEFSTSRFLRFLEVCSPDFLCLQFANYIDWACYDQMTLTPAVVEFIDKLEESVPVAYVGTGEKTMIDRWRDGTK